MLVTDTMGGPKNADSSLVGTLSRMFVQRVFLVLDGKDVTRTRYKKLSHKIDTQRLFLKYV